MNVMAWLLEGDPAIRWQVQRDIAGEPSSVFEAERARVASAGWGAASLAEQEPDGRWGGGLYSPKWTSTFYTMQLLRLLGLPPANPRRLDTLPKFSSRKVSAKMAVSHTGRRSDRCLPKRASPGWGWR